MYVLIVGRSQKPGETNWTFSKSTSSQADVYSLSVHFDSY